MKKPSASTAEDKKFLWYHLSLSPLGDLTGAKQPRKLYRALPVRAYLRFSPATPKGIPHPDHHCLAPAGSSLGGSVDVY